MAIPASFGSHILPAVKMGELLPAHFSRVSHAWKLPDLYSGQTVELPPPWIIEALDAAIIQAPEETPSQLVVKCTTKSGQLSERLAATVGDFILKFPTGQLLVVCGKSVEEARAQGMKIPWEEKRP